MRRNSFVGGLIHFVIGLAELALLFRIVLRLFGANPNALFVHWVYQTSGTLLEPFRGIFAPAVVGHGYVIDFTALFALVVYALVGSLLVFIANWLESSTYPRTSSKK